MGNFTILTLDEGPVKVLKLHGPLTMGESRLGLKKHVKDLADAGATLFLLDMEQVPYVDSTGIVELVSTHTAAKSRGGHLKLALVKPRVHDILGMVRLLDVFEIHPSKEDALKAFGAATGP